MLAPRLALILAALALPTAAHAGGDAAAGAAKALACQACHISVNPASETPHLVGQRPGYVASQLKAFRAGDRKHELMHAIAAQLSDADIDNLAAYWGSQPAGSDTAVPAAAAAIKKSAMPFPAAFPQGFTAYHSEQVAEQKLVSRSYVNAIGLAAARAGKPLPDGTIILVVSYAAKLDAAGQPIAGKDGAWQVDKPVSYSGMEARAGWGKDLPELLRNGTWQYNLFTADKQPRTELNHAACLACHKPAAATSFVFGLAQIQAAAGGAR